MNTYFHKDTCPHCGAFYDSVEKTCPECGQQNEAKRDIHAFDHQLNVGIPFQIIFFLLGLVGQQLLGILLSLLVQNVFLSFHPTATREELVAFVESGGYSMGINTAIYVILAGLFFLFLGLRKQLLPLFRSFKGWKPIVAGVVGFAAIYVAGLLYSIITSIILNLAGIPNPGVNANESALRAMTAEFPILCIVVFGIIGPFCEEVCYRVGLFSFLSRLGKVLAYLLAAVIFGLIHFDWDCFGAADGGVSLLREFINLPTYIGAGAALCFIYDRFGFGASYTAHSLNNLFSIILTITIKE
ncbi:MAG: CPBP family intramembrane metalloprotease [Bacilli bacterium]|nr:CPBP family intramembrane metalloprotease [Bacilli bacterium]